MSLRSSGGLAGLVVACCGLGSQAFAGTAAAPPPIIVLDRSIGGISYHDTPAKVEKTHGPGRVVLRVPGGQQIEYPYDIKVLYELESGRWLAMQIETRSARYRTPQGVGVGSTRKAVDALPKVHCYSDGCDRSTLPNGAGMGTTFQFDRRGRVNWVALGNTSG